MPSNFALQILLGKITNKFNSLIKIRDKKMKLLTSLLIVILIILSGCDQITEINTPPERVINKQLINLPEGSGPIVEAQTYYKEINGANGGEFQKSFSYQKSTGGYVYQFADLDFHPGEFSGTKTFSMTFNTTGAAMEFGPATQFQTGVEYTYKITGLDLTGINPNTLDFVYIDANGNMYQVNYEEITMDASIGMLKVKNARLPHFSRYGFVN